jgi:protein O-mannosyl-transferase
VAERADVRQSSAFMARAWLSVGLIALNLIVYAPVRQFQFVNWDDPTYVTENAKVLGGLTWNNVVWALTTGHAPYWHPATWLSHLLDVQLFGLDAGAHHLTSLAIHVVNTLLIFGWLCSATQATARSAFVAAMFAVHPLHVESVAWIAERKDVLSTLFWSLAIWAYVRYARRPDWRRYVTVIAFYALALMAKPMVVTLPLVLLLIDIWPLRRLSLQRSHDWSRAIGEKVPFLALSTATGIATVIVQHRVGAMAGLDVLTSPQRAANALVGYVAYLAKTIWPANLAAFYPFDAVSITVVGAAALGLAAITAAAIHYRDRYPYFFVGWLWFLITLAPVVGFLQAGEQAMADRFSYVPIVGLFVIVAWGMPDVFRNVTWSPRVIRAAAVLIVVASAVTARAQVEHWRDSVTLWVHAIQVTPNSYLAHENLGQALRERGRLEEARASYARALALTPSGWSAYAAVIHNSLGLISTKDGRTPQAIEEYEVATRLNPKFTEAHINLANALAAEGRFHDALEHYRAATQLEPGLTEAQVGLGSALLQTGNPVEAMTHYQEALRRDPGLAQAHNGLGAALAMSGRNDQAMAHYAEALRLKPDLATAHLNVAVLLVKQGKVAEAKRHLEAALAIDATYAPARQLLARLAGR